MAEITPEERVQKVKAPLLEDLEFEPERVRHFFTSNIIGRAFAHVVGWTGKKALMLRCTSSGELKTAPTTTGIESYGVGSGDAADDWGIGYNPGFVVSRIDMFIWDNPAMLKITKAIGTDGSEFEVPVGFYSIDMRTLLVKIKNKTAGETARYQIVGWW